MPLFHLLLTSLSNMAAICKCLLLARFSTDWFKSSERNTMTADHLPQYPNWALLSPLLCVLFLFLLCLPSFQLQTRSPCAQPLAFWLLGSLSYSAPCKYVHLRRIAYIWLMTLFAQVLMLAECLFSPPYSMVPASLRFPRPLLLMTCWESFKGTQGWNCGVIGINMQTAINRQLCCVIAKETLNHERERFPGYQRVTDQWISFSAGQTGRICNKGLFHWSPKPVLLRLSQRGLLMAE